MEVASDNMKGESGEGAPGGHQHQQQQQQGSNFARGGPSNSTYRSLRSLTAFPKKSATAATVSQQPAAKAIMTSLTSTRDTLTNSQRPATPIEIC